MPILLTRMFAFRRTHKGADIAHSNDFKVFFATSIKSDGGSRRNRKLGRLSARIKVGHCLPLSNFPISQPASPCARRSRPIDVFVLASSDREMSQLENGIRPLVRDTAALSAIALPGLCAVSEALVAVRVIKIPVRHTSWCCGRSDRFLDQR
jgi:hypothetical protein